MKKLIITIAIVLGLGLTSFADGGLFQRGNNAKNGFSGYSYFSANEMGNREGGTLSPVLPSHNVLDNQSATPVGSGIAVLMGLGATYLVGKKRKK